MFNIYKIFLTSIFLFLYSIEIEKNWFYERSKNIFCAKQCSFNISSSYPFSPKIPTDIPVEAILDSYKYIYLIFRVPNDQINKFYLMAYITSTNETIISNGDFYEINLNENNEYEIRIFKELKINSYIQFLFLGLPKNILIKVDIKFKLDLYLYFHDIALSKDNSKNSSNEIIILKFLEDMKKQQNNQIQRLNEVKEITNIILKKMFDITITFNLNEFSFSEIIPAFPYIVTVSYNVGLELSTNEFFEPEKNKFSETKIVNNEIVFHSEDLLKGEVKIDNKLIKFIDLYNKNIQDIILGISLETKSYSLTVSTNGLFDCIIYTFRFFKDINETTIVYEIEIKIEMMNKLLAELVNNQQSILERVFNPETIKNILIIGAVVLLVVLGAIYLPAIGTFAIKVIGGVAGATLNFFGYFYPIKIPIN